MLWFIRIHSGKVPVKTSLHNIYIAEQLLSSIISLNYRGSILKISFHIFHVLQIGKWSFILHLARLVRSEKWCELVEDWEGEEKDDFALMILLSTCLLLWKEITIITLKGPWWLPTQDYFLWAYLHPGGKSYDEVHLASWVITREHAVHVVQK